MNTTPWAVTRLAALRNEHDDFTGLSVKLKMLTMTLAIHIEMWTSLPPMAQSVQWGRNVLSVSCE
jgi:hypothetical protein